MITSANYQVWTDYDFVMSKLQQSHEVHSGTIKNLKI